MWIFFTPIDERYTSNKIILLLLILLDRGSLIRSKHKMITGLNHWKHDKNVLRYNKLISQ